MYLLVSNFFLQFVLEEQVFFTTPKLKDFLFFEEKLKYNTSDHFENSNKASSGIECNAKNHSSLQSTVSA